MLRRVLLSVSLLICAAATAQTPNWSPAGSLSVARQTFTLTPLDDGRVLAAGGFASFPVPGGEQLRSTETVELYDPVIDAWGPAPSLSIPRNGHTATLLDDGRVLAVGGTNDTTEIYDPATNTWSPAASTAEVRGDHTATLLPDGRVLVAGGFTLSVRLATAEIYDPATNTWTQTGSMTDARSDHTATLLPDGRVLVVGGFGSTGLQRRAEVYDPVTATWTSTPPLAHRRFRHTANLLPNGRVLVAGGSSAVAEVFDPVGGTWSTSGAMSQIRRDHTAVLLPDGELLLAGGDGASTGDETATAETYSWLTGTWTPVANMAQVRTRHAAVLLSQGSVLVAGGATFGSDCCIATAEVYGFGPEPIAFTVDTTVDSLDAAPGDGVCSDGAACSLRAAVMEANALPGANVVTLPAGHYTLQVAAGDPEDGEGDLDILDALTINGAGAGSTVIDGSGIDRVLTVGAGRVVELNDLTVTNGTTSAFGGGIYNLGLLTVRRCEIRGNISSSTFAGGGGIFNDGQVTLTGSTISGNRATNGGGIFNDGELTLSNSTVSGNEAVDFDAPENARGGGIVNDTLFGSSSIRQSTVTGNTSSGSGGGLVNACGKELCSVMSVDRSVVAGNQAPSGPDCIAETGSFGNGFRSDGFNLFGSVSGCPFAIAATDLIGTAPMLAPLADYGGSTRTHALRSGSPAIDHIGPADCIVAVDQRGIARPMDAGCDIGAYEAAPCIAEVNAALSFGLVELEFILGARPPAMWTVLARIGGSFYTLWSVALPAADPPLARSLALPLPPAPDLAIVSRIRTGNGVVCTAFVAPER